MYIFYPINIPAIYGTPRPADFYDTIICTKSSYTNPSEKNISIFDKLSIVLAIHSYVWVGFKCDGTRIKNVQSLTENKDTVYIHKYKKL